MQSFQHPSLDFFVLFSLSLLIKTSAWTGMLRWALGWEPTIFSGGRHLNKPLYFSPAPVSQVWLLLWQAARPAFSDRSWRARQEKLDPNRYLGSQLLVVGWPHGRDFPAAAESFYLGHFPCSPSQGISRVKHLAGERKWVSGQSTHSKTGYIEQVYTLGILYHCCPGFLAIWTQQPVICSSVLVGE